MDKDIKEFFEESEAFYIDQDLKLWEQNKLLQEMDQDQYHSDDEL